MNKSIESSGREIVLSKALAWTIFGTIISGGVWVGTELRVVRTELTSIGRSMDAAEQLNSEQDVRIRSVENSDARASAMSANQTQILTRIEQRLERLDTRLRAQEIAQ